ncbi:MAG: FtsQ-type POTRA domain-containing protein [Clostridia bacterium]|nr:FtsQ-type POTRA domain-containing protein [Clostridia bacterium]
MKTTERETKYLNDATPVHLAKRGRVAKILRIGILVLAIVLVLLSFLALALPRFRVREVAVEGASFYRPDEIISASGIRAEDPVLEVDIDRSIQNILAKCRYIKSVSISVHLSGRVVISLEEETCLLYTERDGRYYSFSDSLKIIEEADEPFADFLFVELPHDVTLQTGRAIQFRDSAVFAKSILIPLVNWLENGAFAEHLTAVSLEKERKISFELDGKCKVILGEYRELDKKEKWLKEILADGIPQSPCTIDLSGKNPIKSS